MEVTHQHDANAISPSKARAWAQGCRFYFRCVYGDATGAGRVEAPATLPQRVGTCAHGALDLIARTMKGAIVPDGKRAELILDAIHAQPEATDPAVLARVEKLLTVENLERLGLLDVSKLHATEQAWELTLRDEVEGDFPRGPRGRPALTARGRFDRLDLDVSWGELVITEMKTGGRLTGPVGDDHQALLYTMAGRELADELDAKVNRIRFRQVWLALDIAPRELVWSEELDARARAAAISTLEEIHAEKDWHASPGPACRTCPYVDVCPAWTRSEPPPSLDDAMPLDDLATRAVEFRTRAKVYARRADALESQLANIAAMNGPFVAGGRPVELVTVKGRRSGSVDPDAVARAVAHVTGGEWGRLAPGIAVTSWGRFRAALKGLSKGAKAAAWAAVDVIAPRNAKQKLVIGPLAGEDAEEDEADESAEEAA